MLDRDATLAGHGGGGDRLPLPAPGPRRGTDRRARLALPASEVKNGRDLEHPPPPWAVALLDLYLARGRPVLQAGPGASPWLFPGAREGEPVAVPRRRRGRGQDGAGAAAA